MAEKVQNSVKIAPGAVVCVESESKGDVTIGPRTMIHPKARIIAEAGPIVIGEGNLIEEQAIIINGYLENIASDTEVGAKPMIIGANNVFEVGCYSQAMKIGDNNVIESKAFVGRNVILTSGCIIGPTAMSTPTKSSLKTQSSLELTVFRECRLSSPSHKHCSWTS
ncbi:dynactin subunit 6-like [Lacerta agilis]|uniref:dynactin subunit 6-like n=1 Tax=Lacerta agilis TaxID=80427 RepID=UPI00141A4253|nr:dynactin subunit 6-like [Lacerta agilis]